MSSLSIPYEKAGVPLHDQPPSVDAPTSSSRLWTWASPITFRYSRFMSWRKNTLGLTNPGKIEDLQKEVKSTHLTNFIFDGARADLTKGLSMNPAFQVTHSFSLASQTNPSQYNFGAIFASNKVFMQGNVDHEGNISSRFNYGWTPSSVTKMQAQIASSPVGHSMLQVEQDHQGSDYSWNLKTVNPSPTDLSGLYVGSYLQSVTKNLALGCETLYHSALLPGQPSDFSTSFLAKYAAKEWIATAQLQPAGILQATYWHKLGEKLEVAADLQVIVSPFRRDAVATVGARYNLRTATFRAQLDSSGKVSALLEQQLAPTFAFLVAGEIDHVKTTSKVGVGIMIESNSLQAEETGLPSPSPY
ncbi:eukaryotic porin-domain-containing protein [Cantharellus anzutake]|uniref:eukaryotic porin-domain-containing protein n=1 Tax=Cantharellus anzutake TaxID=1750568 RepID=UPI001904F3B9|nr:eukaryotic porin-domain-containing protein [Cantharellus anzutake]KAF8334310.1 eukaryotic porin-domain-containing protein [Cantharellus anzutake]